MQSVRRRSHCVAGCWSHSSGTVAVLRIAIVAQSAQTLRLTSYRVLVRHCWPHTGNENANTDTVPTTATVDGATL